MRYLFLIFGVQGFYEPNHLLGIFLSKEDAERAARKFIDEQITEAISNPRQHAGYEGVIIEQRPAGMFDTLEIRSPVFTWTAPRYEHVQRLRNAETRSAWLDAVQAELEAA